MDLMALINASGGLTSIAKEVGISEGDAQAGAAALLPGLVNGLQKQVTGGAGIEGLAGMLMQAGGGSLLQNVLGQAPTDVSMGNNLLGQLLGSKDVSRAVAAQAAQATGIDQTTLQKMLPMLAMVVSGLLANQGAGSAGLGGLGGLLAGALGGGAQGSVLGGLGKMLDANKDGNPLDDLAGLAGKLFG
jgi:hypothetical protein